MKTATISLLCSVVILMVSSLSANAQGYWQEVYYRQPYSYWPSRSLVYYYEPRYAVYEPRYTYAAYTEERPRHTQSRKRGRAVAVVAPRPSAVACDNYASSYARDASMQGDILAGGAFGSLAGLGIGALFAASGVGAAIGATAGIVGGAAVRNQREQQLYAAAYQDCMSGLVR